MSVLAGLTLIYLIPAILAVPFWWGVRRLAKVWDGRDFMDSVRPEARHVHHTETLLGVRNKLR